MNLSRPSSSLLGQDLNSDSVELMVPVTAARLPTSDGFAHEPKWDGLRPSLCAHRAAFGAVTDGQVRTPSRASQTALDDVQWSVLGHVGA
jgi:hypothetical protein